jgi:hypothetical protein
MGRHHPVAAIVFRVVERGPVDAGFQIVGNDKPRHPTKKAGHADMGLDPVRQFLRPGCLGVSVIGSATLKSWLESTHVATFELVKRPDGKPGSGSV